MCVFSGLDYSFAQPDFPEYADIDEACTGEGLIPEYSHNTHLQADCSQKYGGKFIVSREANLEGACMPKNACDYLSGAAEGLEIYKREC